MLNQANHIAKSLCYTYTTGSSALPDIHIPTSPRAAGPRARAYISGKARVPVV